MGMYSCDAVVLLSFGLKCPLVVIGSHRHRIPLLVESPRQISCKCSSAALGEVVVVVDKEEGTEQRTPRFSSGLNLTDEQDEAITRIPIKMSKRCQALMRQIICFSSEKGSFCDLLAAWVRRMSPIRADWLSLLKELKNLDSPFYINVAEFSLLEDSFEANPRDYTKIIHYYGKLNQVEEAERTLLAMKNRGFLIDQVTLTAMVQLYSKAGYHKLAEDTFNDIKLLGEPLDYRSYGSMIMAYIRAGAPEKGEALLRDMDSQEICAGREVYKALLRAYSMGGDAQGAKRVFDAVQIAGITPDVKLCGLLINAYSVLGQSQNARLAFENMRKAGIKATDKCVALVLAAYEKEEKLNEALGFLVELEKDSIMIEKEASAVLARWFKKLGVVEEVELLLREFSSSQSKPL
ncbi:PREDICTED: pentatricopeptide repeat-containing protein At1g01970-like [Camelina sativa]|uniref:Pentatricopeptide repeat-containing protein At1g01970-like n=1 Tax=Camelina sativa TaxID=90675 RepID=A0ABM0WQR5_CAMSA|nr:PREDICTED: pentatricopeptide repeat-containing protein At1g01970-like [Camelina sativa]